MTDTATGALTRVPRLEATGVALVTIVGAFSPYAVVYGLGSGEPLSLMATTVALLVCVSAVLMWRLGPRRVEPLVAGLLLCGVGGLLMDLPLLAGLPVVMAGAIALRRAATSSLAD